MLEVKIYVSTDQRRGRKRDRYQVRYIIDWKGATQLISCRPPSPFYVPPLSHDSGVDLASASCIIDASEPSLDWNRLLYNPRVTTPRFKRRLIGLQVDRSYNILRCGCLAYFYPFLAQGLRPCCVCHIKLSQDTDTLGKNFLCFPQSGPDSVRPIEIVPERPEPR